MKVLLFVQTGDARPKAMKCPFEWERKPERVALQAAAWRNCNPTPARCGAVLAAVIRADRWWLVECANAEDGRDILAMNDYNGSTRSRILASGGRRA